MLREPLGVAKPYVILVGSGDGSNLSNTSRTFSALLEDLSSGSKFLVVLSVGEPSGMTDLRVGRPVGWQACVLKW